MLSTRATILLVSLLTSSLALPPSSQNHLRGSVRAKQTTPSYSNEPRPPIATSNNVSKQPVTTSTSSVPASTETAPLSSASSLASTLASRSSVSSSSVSAARSPTPGTISTTASATTSRTVDPTVTTRSSAPSSSVSASGSSSISASVPTTTASSIIGPSVAPLETSSRTISSAQDATTFLSSSRKSTTTSGEHATTAASVSAKETRESPGKIRPQIKITTNYTSIGETGVRLPEGASAALAKPTKYHYYPHNQHIYLLPECAVQQVCNAVYVRLNFTQPLCACPGRYRDPCSASLDSDDLHTTELVTDPRTKALTLVKTCEPVAEMRECRTPRDWSLLALQNVRTGKSHYLVICRCPDANILEGPMSHDQPTYASVPGIRVYGMMCVQGNRRGRPLRYKRGILGRSESEKREDVSMEFGDNDDLRFPWHKVDELMKIADWD